MSEEWIPAETMKEDAPKFGEHFLICRVGGEKMGDACVAPDRIGLAHYIPDYRDGWKLETNYQANFRPTHWMKIRELPRPSPVQKPTTWPPSPSLPND